MRDPLGAWSIWGVGLVVCPADRRAAAHVRIDGVPRELQVSEHVA